MNVDIETAEPYRVGHAETADTTRQMIGLLAVTGRDPRPEIDALMRDAIFDLVPDNLGMTPVDWIEMCSRHAHPEWDGPDHAQVSVGVLRRLGRFAGDDEEGSE